MNKVTYEERKAIYEDALERWGADAQIVVAIEEMSELTKEICKLKRGKRDMEALADEIADVTMKKDGWRSTLDAFAGSAEGGSMNHDATHCADYTTACPKGCYRAQLTADLREIIYPLPTSWANSKGSKECPKWPESIKEELK